MKPRRLYGRGSIVLKDFDLPENNNPTTRTLCQGLA